MAAPNRDTVIHDQAIRGYVELKMVGARAA